MGEVTHEPHFSHKKKVLILLLYALHVPPIHIEKTKLKDHYLI